MGLFSNLIQSSSVPYNSGSLTPLGGFHPGDPGDLSTIRTVPVLKSDRAFTPPEAAALQELAKQRQDLSRAKADAYRALSQVESLDAQDQQQRRQYQSAVAEAELVKQQANSEYLALLNTQRPAYAQSAAQLMATHQAGNQQIAVTEARTSQILKGWGI